MPLWIRMSVTLLNRGGNLLQNMEPANRHKLYTPQDDVSHSTRTFGEAMSQPWALAHGGRAHEMHAMQDARTHHAASIVQ